MTDNLKIVQLTNTFGFKGLESIEHNLRELFQSSGWPSQLFASSLPIEWQKGLDQLHFHAEEKINHLTTCKLPAISTKEVQGISAIKDDGKAKSFQEYQHNVGEVYLIKSLEDLKEDSEKSVAVLDIDWMISLLKEVYRHDFDSKMDSAKYSFDFRLVKDKDFALAKQMRVNQGLIPESILKPLWKCNGKDELFKRIVTLFKNFNLTYPCQGPLPSYFFPYLRKSKIPEEYISGTFSLKYKQVITLRYVFKFFFPRFFLQRLALQVNSCNNPTNKGTEIYDNGFLAELGNGDQLVITQAGVNRPNQEEIRIHLCSHSTQNPPDLWSRMPGVLQCIHSILSNYWKFHGDTEVSVVCPRCVKSSREQPNSLHLMQFRDDNRYGDFQCRKVLLCKECNEQVPVGHMVPSRSHDLSDLESHQMFKIDIIEDEKDFNSKLSAESGMWVIESPAAACDSATSTSEPKQLPFHQLQEKHSLDSYSHTSPDFSFLLEPSEEQGNNT